MGNWDGNLNYIENTGTPKAPAFMLRSGSLNPFNGNVVEGAAFADLDGDGYPDLVVGYDDGSLTYSLLYLCLLYTSPSPRDQRGSRMPSSA